MTNCPLVAAASGGVYLAGQICGTATGVSGNASTPGIVHVAPDGTLTHVAGHAAGSTSDGTVATNFKMDGALGLARDGNTLYVGNGPTRTVSVAIGGTVTTVAGNGTAGSAGDYGPATSAQIASNNAYAIMPGAHLVISDGSNRALRIVW
jgi:hypothetical protein